MNDREDDDEITDIILLLKELRIVSDWGRPWKKYISFPL